MTESKIEKKAQKSKIKNILNKSVIFTIIALILIAVFSIALTPVTFQNDTYYTIKIGEHIAQEGIDMKDPFSWHEDLAYTNNCFSNGRNLFSIMTAFEGTTN